jgi:hypothetical protein
LGIDNLALKLFVKIQSELRPPRQMTTYYLHAVDAALKYGNYAFRWHNKFNSCTTQIFLVGILVHNRWDSYVTV